MYRWNVCLIALAFGLAGWLMMPQNAQAQIDASPQPGLAQQTTPDTYQQGQGPRDGSGQGARQGQGPRDGSGAQAGQGQGPRDGSGQQAGRGQRRGQGPRDGTGPNADQRRPRYDGQGPHGECRRERDNENCRRR